jgi:hypothetical protein
MKRKEGGRTPSSHNVDFHSPSFQTRTVKYLFPLFCLLICLATPSFAQTAEKKPYIVYAEFVADTPVDLSDGSRWMMDKGDCFPIDMFKERHTKVILKLAGTTFMTPIYSVRILKDSEAERGRESYQKMVDNYFRTQAAKGKKEGAQ